MATLPLRRTVRMVVERSFMLLHVFKSQNQNEPRRHEGLEACSRSLGIDRFHPTFLFFVPSWFFILLEALTYCVAWWSKLPGADFRGCNSQCATHSVSCCYER